MSSYITLSAVLLLVISPVLLPLLLEAVGMLADLFSNDDKPVANTGSRTPAMAAAD